MSVKKILRVRINLSFTNKHGKFECDKFDCMYKIEGLLKKTHPKLRSIRYNERLNNINDYIKIKFENDKLTYFVNPDSNIILIFNGKEFRCLNQKEKKIFDKNYENLGYV